MTLQEWLTEQGEVVEVSGSGVVVSASIHRAEIRADRFVWLGCVAFSVTAKGALDALAEKMSGCSVMLRSRSSRGSRVVAACELTGWGE